MRNAGPQQPHQCAQSRHLPFRGQEQMGSQSLPATIGRGGQSLQPGHRQRERTELHDAARDLGVGDQAAHAVEQEAIARGIGRIVERGLEYGRIAAAEDLREEMSQSDMIGDTAGDD